MITIVIRMLDIFLLVPKQTDQVLQEFCSHKHSIFEPVSQVVLLLSSLMQVTNKDCLIILSYNQTTQDDHFSMIRCFYLYVQYQKILEGHTLVFAISSPFIDLALPPSLSHVHNRYYLSDDTHCSDLTGGLQKHWINNSGSVTYNTSFSGLANNNLTLIQGCTSQIPQEPLFTYYNHQALSDLT